MNGLRRNSRNTQCRKYQQAGSQAVRLEVRGRWQEVAGAWLPDQTGNSLPCKEQSIASGVVIK